VTLSIANHHASLPITYRLYLPQAWANGAASCTRAMLVRLTSAPVGSPSLQLKTRQIEEGSTDSVFMLYCR
jgi:hypothetical protein